MIRVAAYCRVSTDKEDQANSFETQQHFFREWIGRKPEWVLQGIYADEGLSGTSTQKRAQFNRMIQAAREGRIDLIITKEVSRFARNTVDTLAYTRELRKRGVGVWFLNDNIHTLDADGELRLTIMSSIAQNESRLTSDRVKWGQRCCMERGVVFGRSLLGYDVTGGRITVNPGGANVVRTIFHKYLHEGKGAGVIARELQEAGIPSSRGNVQWSAPTVLKILKNEKYCGDLIQQKTYTPDYLSHEKKYNHGQLELVVLRDHHEPIIDRETWEAVQSEMIRRRTGSNGKSGHGSRYPLSGKLKCAQCGSSFLARTKKTSSGETYQIWRCGKAVTQGRMRTDVQGTSVGCNVGRQIRTDVAMDLLKRSVAAVEFDREGVIRALTRMVEDVLKNCGEDAEADLRRLNRELEREQAKKQRGLEEFLSRTISREDFQFINERCNEKIAQLRTSLMEEQRRLDAGTGGVKEDVRAAIKGIVSGERACDAFYGHLLHQMTIHRDGTVEVILHALPARFDFSLGGSRQALPESAQSEAAVPISVRSAFSSGYGMEKRWER